MDDLIVFLLGAFLFAIVAALAVFAAVAVLACAMAVTTAWAFGAGLSAFTGDFRGSVLTRGGQRRAPRDPEPAFELYVLGQVFADFRHGLEHAASVLGATRGQISGWSVKYQKGATWPLAIGAIVGGWVGTLFAAALGALCGLLVAMLVAVIAGISWVLIWLLRIADAVRRRVRHASYECPADHERFPLPVYVCPACGAEHRRLVPGRWGIFKRECRCGQTGLPTTVIGGRQRVPQRCPSGHPMSGLLGYAENLPVAIVGGPSSGKSTFLAGALVELEAPQAGVYIEPLSESRDAYSRLVDAMRSGEAPEKTADDQRPALVAEIQGSGRSRALYAYDLAGEVYSAEDRVRSLRFLGNSAGLVLLVDPFSIAHVADDHAQELAGEAARVYPSSEDPMRVYERLLATLKEAAVQTQQMPLAVVIAKTDALGIQQEIDRLTQPSQPGSGEQAWLQANGAGNLVRAIEEDFKHVGWFSLSALGRMPDPANKTPFVPRGALAPLLWILARRGVHPSAQAASATHTAERLTGTAVDFPAPTAAARARNASLVAALGTLALLAAVIALVAVSKGTGAPPSITAQNAAASSGAGGRSSPEGGKSSSEGSGPSGHGDRTGLAASTTKGATFTIRRPGGSWVLDHAEVQKPGYIETRWHRRGQPEVVFLVDHTPGYSGTARAGAEGVSKSFAHISSYRELDFAEEQLPAGEAWRWEYEDGGERSVDTFSVACDTGYAVRGAAPDDEWSRYAKVYEEATATLTPACGE
jgi:hypothetical protein